MKKALIFSNSTTLTLALLLIAGLLTSTAGAEIIEVPGITVETYYPNPHEGGEIINSFDFGRTGTLYYTTGVKGPEGCETGLTVYRYADDSYERIYHKENAYGFSGGRIRSYGKGSGGGSGEGSGQSSGQATGERILFNDGGTESRMGFNYYAYDPEGEEQIRTIIRSERPGAGQYWGLSTRDGTDLWAAGAPVLDFGENHSHIYYGSLDFDDTDTGSGSIDDRMIDLGLVGGGSGPLAFDSAGNLYYAQGYNWPFESDAYIYRFSAAEVADAMEDPENNPLEITDAHLFETIIFDGWIQGFLGASSMFFNNKAGLVLTATTAHGPSELRRYAINPDGTSGDYTVLAASTGRMSETRCHKGKIYFNDPDGIYLIDMASPGMTMTE
jgi:hypothetical protein